MLRNFKIRFNNVLIKASTFQWASLLQILQQNFFYKSYLILPDKIAMIFNDGHKSSILSSCSFLRIHVASSRVVTNILQSALLFSPLNLRYSFISKHRFVYTQNEITWTNNTSVNTPIH